MALGRATRQSDLAAVQRTAREIAERYPSHRPAQQLAGEVAYRASNWTDASRYLGRAGLMGEVSPDLVFYLAVARYETGDLEGSRVALRAALPRLAPSPFLDQYVKKILGVGE